LERRCSIGSHPRASRDTRYPRRAGQKLRPTIELTGVEPAATGYMGTMKQIHDEEDAALRGEVRQSLALVGAVTFLVVAGLVVGLAL
jgi:hypothetical protein